jgi:molybdate transport system substrate-binding protein
MANGGVAGSSDSDSAVDVLSTLALRGVLTEIADDFRARSGFRIAATYKSTNAVLTMIGEGARADVIIATREAIDRLLREDIIARGSTADIALSGVGIAVRAGAPKPDIGTVAAFKRALLETKSISFSRQGASGIHFAEVIERLGIAEEVRRKAKIIDTYVGELAARGEVELAVQQISELMPVAGIDIVGPLPAELQKISIFSAGVFAAARNPAGGRKLVALLAAPALAPVLMRKGLEPATAARSFTSAG